MQKTKRYMIRALPGLLAIAAITGCLRPGDPDLPDIPELTVVEFAEPVRQQILAARAQLLETPEDARRNLRLGKILHAYKLQSPAIRCYQRARELQPGDYETAYLLGIAQAQMGDDAGATANLRAAIRLQPDYAPARLRLGEVLFKTGELAQAQTLFEELLAQEPDSAWAHHRLAQVLAALDDAEGAIGNNRRAVELYRDFGPAHYALALAFRNRGDTELAQAHMERYRRQPKQTPAHVDPLLASLDALDISATAHVRRAKRLQASGQPREALLALEQAVRVEPQSIEAHSQLIRLYHRLNDADGVERHYRAVTAIEPHAVMANLEYGTLLAEQGRFADAAAAFEKVLAAHPDHSAAHTLLGQAMEELQQQAGAERHYRLALENDPNNRRAGLLLGRLLMLTDRRTEATTHLDGVAQHSDSDQALYLQRIAQVYREAGEHERAMTLLEQARTQAAAQGQERMLHEITQTMTHWRETQ
ncbi:MAG: tetratricopeptide repeat protein [Halobacteria archaeon]|nr:tetratricopeptide repeat protein [Halobacteria archaeon]